MAKTLTCPICRKDVASEGNAYRPFCSRRCKDIDLASWLDGNYRISRPLDDAELESRPGWSPDRANAEDDPDVPN